MSEVSYDSRLVLGGIAHGIVGLIFMMLLLIPMHPITGVHAALKPMKFGFSVGIFLLSMAFVLPTLRMNRTMHEVVSVLLLVTMIFEMLPIGLQALRGTTSHFNISTGFNAALWRLMVGSIVITTITMVFLAGVSLAKPLWHFDGTPMDPLMAMAVRASLSFFVFAAISGFAMGSRMSHSVGGMDGGAGIPVLNFSRTHGDLRVSHFFAMHALQALPLMAMFLNRIPMTFQLKGLAMVGGVVGWGLITLVTLIRAFQGRALW